VLSVQSHMELLQGASDGRQHELTRAFLRDFGFMVLPLSEGIGHRAAVYIEEYSLSHGLRPGDALVAATATEHNLALCAANARNLRAIKDLDLVVLRP
jgi:predicted nucleic acid-binding protein